MPCFWFREEEIIKGEAGDSSPASFWFVPSIRLAEALSAVATAT
jgi:hypothetical protein